MSGSMGGDYVTINRAQALDLYAALAIALGKGGGKKGKKAGAGGKGTTGQKGGGATGGNGSGGKGGGLGQSGGKGGGARRY
jgi:hypothetical protein